MVAHQSVSITTPKGSGRFCDHLFGREQRTVWQYGNTGSSSVVGYPTGVTVPLTCLQYEYLEYKPLCRYQRIGCRHTSERIHQHNNNSACQPCLHTTSPHVFTTAKKKHYISIVLSRQFVLSWRLNVDRLCRAEGLKKRIAL